MTHAFEITNEIAVDATPDQVWAAITSGPGMDSWFMGRTEVDPDARTTVFDMFGNVAKSNITEWEPGKRYAAREETNPDGTFMAFDWLIEAQSGGTSVIRWVHSGELGDNWEAEYEGMSIGDHAYATKLKVYLEHFAPRAATSSPFLPGPVAKDPWARLCAAVGAGPDAADGQPARLTVPGIAPVDGTVEYVHGRSFVGMRTADATYTLIHGFNDMVLASAHYFDDQDRTAELEAWQSWLATFA